MDDRYDEQDGDMGKIFGGDYKQKGVYIDANGQTQDGLE